MALLLGVLVVVVLPGSVDLGVEPCVDGCAVRGQGGCGCGECSAFVQVQLAVTGCYRTQVELVVGYGNAGGPLEGTPLVPRMVLNPGVGLVSVAGVGVPPSV